MKKGLEARLANEDLSIAWNISQALNLRRRANGNQRAVVEHFSGPIDKISHVHGVLPEWALEFLASFNDSALKY